MKKLFKVLSLALVAMMLVACSGGNGGNEGGQAAAEPAEIVFWHTLTDHDEENVKEIVDAFNAANEGVYHVTQETQPLDGFEAKVLESVTNGVGPNLVWLYPGTATEYVGEGLALDFGQYLTDADVKNRVSEGIWASVTDYEDGKMHAVPGTLTGPIMFYNQDLLDKYGQAMPTTWDELLEVCKVVVDGEKAEGHDIMGFGPDSVDTLGIIVLKQLGLEYINADKTANDWTDQKFVDWLNWWKQAEADGYFQLVDPEGYHSGPFGNQNYLCYLGSSAGIGYINHDSFNMTTGAVPQVAGGKNYTETTVRALVGFTKGDASDEGAAKFAAFFANAENNTKFVQTYGAASPYLDVAASDEYKNYAAGSPAIQALALMTDYAGTRTNVVGQQACKEAITQALKIAVAGTETVEALTTAQAQANAALSE
ncbi:MAG: extracellular solute-binding protein [Erysipelotrichaceae bacterium]|nr:extracellular solute-binding protein [Erysipelotrichaceae bacterium]